jgi:hypothetical protein
MWRTLKQLVKEFWIPFVIAGAWTSYVVGLSEKLTTYISCFAPSFFLASWITGQINRVRKEGRVKDSFDAIEQRLDLVVHALDIRIDGITERSNMRSHSRPFSFLMWIRHPWLAVTYPYKRRKLGRRFRGRILEFVFEPT